MNNDDDWSSKAIAQEDPSSLQFLKDNRDDKDDYWNDKEVVIVAVERNHWFSKVQEGGWKNLQHAPYEIRNNKRIVMVAVQKAGLALEHASPELQNDKEVVMVAVRENFNALLYASPELQNDKQVVMVAAKRNDVKALLQYASPSLRDDKAVVMTAVKKDGYALQYASPWLQNDKDVVLAAIKKNRDAIKYVHNDLKRDRDVLVAAGMFDECHDVIRQGKDVVRKIAFSTRFSLTPTSYSQATKFTSLLKQHEYIQNGNFKIYAPNAFDKHTCDPEWTRFDWPCRGTKDTCCYINNNVLTDDGRPTDDCCWRYSFRSQLQEAKETDGFMLQLIEADKWKVGEPQRLGNGQRIELDMAQTLGVKVFQVYRPTNDTMNDAERYELPFNKKHIDIVTNVISRWYTNNNKQCQEDDDMMSSGVVTVIRP